MRLFSFRSLPNFNLFILALLSIGLHSEVTQTSFYGYNINWTDYRIEITGRKTLPRIQIDPEFNAPSEETVSHLGEARDRAYRQALGNNRRKLSIALERMVLDENYTLGEYLETNPKIKERYLEYFNENPETEQVHYNQNEVVLMSQLKLLGKGSLVSLFYGELGGDKIPELEDDLPSEEFSGIIFDARGLDFHPSLFPKIQLDDGRDILNRFIAHPASVQELGIALYAEDENRSFIKKRVGRNPYTIFPVSVSGKNKTNLVVAYEEGKKIISSLSNRKNLRLCKIVILVDSKVQ